MKLLIACLMGVAFTLCACMFVLAAEAAVQGRGLRAVAALTIGTFMTVVTRAQWKKDKELLK